MTSSDCIMLLSQFVLDVYNHVLCVQIKVTKQLLSSLCTRSASLRLSRTHTHRLLVLKKFLDFLEQCDGGRVLLVQLEGRVDLLTSANTTASCREGNMEGKTIEGGQKQGHGRTSVQAVPTSPSS